ncbi:MAG: bifunctional phosphopantothenoylcysteine decarboxylase/phosphopantothenate--cysteine ligase CoaBC [Aquificaceae bacterium]|nr:bifunctional phosphopantothenoylcysteine decarboxylase/phosphopantothenate--cysteine ligase CoaBC [Aquificaceae bacterium]
MANVLLGVCASVAIYKSCDIIRELTKKGHQVRVIMTPASASLISPTLFSSLCDFPAYVDWSLDPLAHINLPRWCDAFLIAPCSINTISKIALGIGDNLLTSSILAHSGKLLIAPAANTQMLKKPIIKKHLRLLSKFATIIDPQEGQLVCKEYGEGKLAPTELICSYVERAVSSQTLKNKRFLIALGATEEPIDSVRVISNLSSGKMGIEIARQLWLRGADIQIVAGKTSMPVPKEFKTHHIRTSSEMLKALLELSKDADCLIMPAAVSDFRPKIKSSKKIERSNSLILELEPTQDIISTIRMQYKDLFILGFALEEPENIYSRAKQKLNDKNLNAIVANTTSSIGSERIDGFLLTTMEKIDLKGPKEDAAKVIASWLEKKLGAEGI